MSTWKIDEEDSADRLRFETEVEGRLTGDRQPRINPKPDWSLVEKN
jgi:hypothetical protein